MGLPTPRVERWKYTSLTPIQNLDLVPGANDKLPAAMIAGADRVVLGAKIERNVGDLPAGVYLGSIVDAPDAARVLLGTLAPSESDALVALNAALADDALVLFVPNGVGAAAPDRADRADPGRRCRLSALVGRAGSQRIGDHRRTA